jgi:hypothetical protein
MGAGTDWVFDVKQVIGLWYFVPWIQMYGSHFSVTESIGLVLDGSRSFFR